MGLRLSNMPVKIFSEQKIDYDVELSFNGLPQYDAGDILWNGKAHDGFGNQFVLRGAASVVCVTSQLEVGGSVSSKVYIKTFPEFS